MKVLRYRVHNVLRLSDVDLSLEGSHLFLVGGRNNQGKSSALIALLMALCGRSGMDWPEFALKEGEDDGAVTVSLAGEGEDEPAGLTVQLELHRKRDGSVSEKLSLRDTAGEKVQQPRQLLKKLCELHAFDPLAFEKLDRKAKRNLLAKLVDLDTSDQDARLSNLREERNARNRDGTRLKARLQAMPVYHGVPEREVSVAELSAEHGRAVAQNLQNDKDRGRLDESRQLRDRISNENQALELTITSLKEKLRNNERLLATVTDEVQKQEKHVKSLVDCAVGGLLAKISEAEALNKKVRANRDRMEVEVELDRLRDGARTLAQKIKEAEKERADRIAAANWPVEGLGFDGEGVTLGGLPFEQRSKSERILTSVRVGMALNPTLKLLVCQDGNDLDNDSMEALEETLRKEGYQMLVEVVTRGHADEERCSVVIEDGTEKGV